MRDFEYPIKLLNYEDHFQALQNLAYKDLIINQVNIRILGIHLMNNGPDWRVNQHKHSFFEFHYVTEDYVFTTLNQTEYQINPNHFYLIPPGVYHAHHQESGTQHIGFALRWEITTLPAADSNDLNIENILNKMLLNLKKASLRPFPDKQFSILKALSEIFFMVENHEPIIQLQLALARLVIHIADFYQEKTLDQNPIINDAFIEDHMIKNALNFINENYTQPITVADVSHAVHLSYSQLARLFKKYTGYTITHHLNLIRLGQAQFLLKCSTKSIRQIALEVGYHSEYYFCSLFKKFFRQSPRSYRLNQNRLTE